jgi:phosphoglycolate phosphatase
MRHLFFDLDGTLTDPADGIVACLQYAIRTLDGPEWPAEQLCRFIGPPLHDSFQEILATHDPETLRVAIGHYRDRFSSQGIFENRVYPAIPDALAELQQAGFRLWVVTSKPEVYADRIVDHFGLRSYFADVYGAELSGERSAKSDLIAHVLEQERIHPSSACMIGDRRHDIQGAKAHPGMLGVGVLWGYGTQHELEAAGADALVDRIATLPAALHRLPWSRGTRR